MSAGTAPLLSSPLVLVKSLQGKIFPVWADICGGEGIGRAVVSLTARLFKAGDMILRDYLRRWWCGRVAGGALSILGPVSGGNFSRDLIVKANVIFP